MLRTCGMRNCCPLCAGGDLWELPLLSNAGRGMISDGRLVSHPLHKISCLVCGGAFCAETLEPSEVARWYSDGYSLTAAAPEADAARARSYGDWLIAGGLGRRPVGRVLEVGAGSGCLLQDLASRFPMGEFIGCQAPLSKRRKSSVLRSAHPDRR